MEKYLLNLIQSPILYKLQQSFGGANDLKREAIESEVDIKNVKTVLDIGCGIGDTSLIFQNLDINYLGIDLNKKRIDYANKNYGNPQTFFKKLSVEHLDKNLSFDLVLCFGLVHHLKDKEISNFLKKISNSNFEFKKIIFLDPVKLSDQSFLATLLHKIDIGQNIKSQEEYDAFFNDFNRDYEILFSKKLKWAPTIKMTVNK
jgi:SAM-dependent methyltransferase|tara:strand:- start:114 stop:719 length:606 start_codon:yes stop_codon:yes gene_type:complete